MTRRPRVCRDTLPMRGRGRIGRGGRLVFDICSRRAAATSSDGPLSDDGGGEGESPNGGQRSGEGESCTSGPAAACDVVGAKRRRERWEALRSAPGPDSRKARGGWLQAVWDEMRALDRRATVSGPMVTGHGRACWNYGTAANNNSYLD